MDTVVAHRIAESVQELADTYEGLAINKGHFKAQPNFNFVRMARHPDVPPLRGLPYIQTDYGIDYLVPATIDLPKHLESLSSTQLVAPVEGHAFIPAKSDDWITRITPDEVILKELLGYHQAVESELELEKARSLLADERSEMSDLYASAKPVGDQKAMLVDRLFGEGGVSVIVGDFDEFKTTVVVDMMAHIAYGTDWQGKIVRPHPIIYYQLDTGDDITIRLRALEAKLQSRDTPWGDDRAPFTVLDRIPEDRSKAWRAQIRDYAIRWCNVHNARRQVGEIPDVRYEYVDDGETRHWDEPRYPSIGVSELATRPVIVIDTLSIALGGGDEKGHAAASFIHDCLDLLKERPDLDSADEHTLESIGNPVAAHIIIIHHQTKNGTDFAGHRAIGADTQGLYRIHRFGKITDAERSLGGRLTPIRTKGMPRPAPFQFEVEIVPVAGTNQTAAILKDRAAGIAEDLLPVIEALRQFDAGAQISAKELNECLDLAAGEKDGATKRKARQRLRERLEDAGVLEPVEDDAGNVTFYRFHDIGAPR